MIIQVDFLEKFYDKFYNFVNIYKVNIYIKVYMYVLLVLQYYIDNVISCFFLRKKIFIKVFIKLMLCLRYFFE